MIAPCRGALLSYYFSGHISATFYNHKFFENWCLFTYTSHLFHWLSRWRHPSCLTSIGPRFRITLPAFRSLSYLLSFVFFSFPPSIRSGVHWLRYEMMTSSPNSKNRGFAHPFAEFMSAHRCIILLTTPLRTRTQKNMLPPGFEPSTLSMTTR